MLPAAAWWRSNHPYCRALFERLVVRRDFPRVAAYSIYTFSESLPLSPAGLARYRQGEFLNRVVADLDTLQSSLSARYLAAGGRFCGDYGGDNRVKFPYFTLAFTLGGIMLLTLFLMPPLFIVRKKHRAKSDSSSRTVRQQLTAWLQGQAELPFLVPAIVIARN